jgi:hypothetical protein
MYYSVTLYYHLDVQMKFSGIETYHYLSLFHSVLLVCLLLRDIIRYNAYKDLCPPSTAASL